jgi:hypothetical protein
MEDPIGGYFSDFDVLVIVKIRAMVDKLDFCRRSKTATAASPSRPACRLSPCPRCQTRSPAAHPPKARQNVHPRSAAKKLRKYSHLTQEERLDAATERIVVPNGFSNPSTISTSRKVDVTPNPRSAFLREYYVISIR